MNDLATIDRELNEIIALAHTGRSADQSRYAELQPRLQELAAAKTAGGQRVPAAAGQAPASIAAYPSLPDSPAVTSADRADWATALPEMLAMGLSVDQVFKLADLMVRTTEKQVTEVRQSRDAVQRQTEAVLQQRYGANWKARVAAADQALKRARRHDKHVSLADFILSDGSRAFDNAVLVSLLIDYAEAK
jgi:hypothetical protein